MQRTLLNQFLCHTIIISLIANFTLYPYDQSFRNHIVNSNINTLTTIQEKVLSAELPVTDSLVADLIHSLQAPRVLKLKNLTIQDKRTLIFEQIQHCLNHHDTIIDQFFVDKMNLVHGYTNPHDHLMNRLMTDIHGNKLLKTEIGAKRCIELLTQPTITTATLLKRQAIIKELVRNNNLRIQCNKLLDTIHTMENYFFELYSKEGLEKSEQNLFKFQAFFTQFGLHPTASLTLSTRFLQVLQAFGIFSLILLAVGSTTEITKKIASYQQALIQDPEKLENDLLQFAEKSFLERSAKLRRVTSEMFFIFTTPFQTLLGLAALKDNFDEILNIQEILIGFTTYLRSLATLFHLFEKNCVIKRAIPEIKSLLQELVHNPAASKDFNHLNDLLAHATFAQKSPSIFSRPGHILTAYQCLAQPTIRKEYSAVLNMLGEIDTYVALANKIISHQQYPTTCAQFCFVEFIDHASVPHLKAVNFWNPFIDAKKVICNTISLNTGHERNVILTGTNTGGKSTLLKALVILLLLAQTFGIATAQSLTMTPFYKCIIDMNITDDIGAGLSLFKAEVQRAHEILTILQTLPTHQCAFVIIDEIFRGTSHEKGEKLAFNFMQYLTTFKNCIFITATHFEQLINLEQLTGGEIKNYHMGVEVDDAGNVTKYTHTLLPGPSPIANTEQIAEELYLDLAK